ncbi:hypothetical protein G4177_12530 [Corallococcus sp. ZKHCc1 1396]|uniref:Lipoprotein n=1 Tax=Corallococcus soli TaxID=2710757 RepID=A0ABR9PM46_9BACT|nr:hypothetical protein [Corallococcus soli]MBE4748988.1 hypothetical protein [Corallococcus soli]
MPHAREDRRPPSWMPGLLLAATTLTACGQDAVGRRYEGRYAMALQVDSGPHQDEGPLDVALDVYIEGQATLTQNKLRCTLAARYVPDVRAPGADGREVEYEELRDVQPDQTQVCPAPEALGENRWLEFRFGRGRIENRRLSLSYSGDVWQGTSADLADARGTRLGTFAYAFEGGEVAVP